MSKIFSLEDAQRIGDALGIDWQKYPLDQFVMGLNIELEHGTRDHETNVTNDDEIMTGKIVLAHLKEMPDYYTRLAEMEKSAGS